MLDQFIYGGVSRISPEALPVPVLEFSLVRPTCLGGAASTSPRNLVSLGVSTELFGVIGQDDAARKLQKLLGEQKIGGGGLIKTSARHTSIKTRIVAHQQQLVRVDRESRGAVDDKDHHAPAGGIQGPAAQDGCRHRGRLRARASSPSFC